MREIGGYEGSLEEMQLAFPDRNMTSSSSRPTGPFVGMMMTTFTTFAAHIALPAATGID